MPIARRLATVIRLEKHGNCKEPGSWQVNNGLRNGERTNGDAEWLDGIARKARKWWRAGGLKSAAVRSNVGIVGQRESGGRIMRRNAKCAWAANAGVMPGKNGVAWQAGGNACAGGRARQTRAW